MSENVGASTSRNPKGLHGLYRDNVTSIAVKTSSFLFLNITKRKELYKTWKISEISLLFQFERRCPATSLILVYLTVRYLYEHVWDSKQILIRYVHHGDGTNLLDYIY
jgi:hypothetical protein